MNKDLGGVFGNLVNRCLSFATTRFDATVPKPGEPAPLERRLVLDLDTRLASLRAHHEALEFRKAAEDVLDCLGEPVAWPTSADTLPAGRRIRLPPVLFPKISAACLPPG